MDLDTDLTILHALAREMHEETGLVMRRAVALLDDGVEFSGRGGTTRWRKITFLVDADVDVDVDVEEGDGKGNVTREGEDVDGEVDGMKDEDCEKKEGDRVVRGGPRVKLNPEEHVDYVWAGEEEVRAGGVCDGREVVFAYDGAREVILEGLRMASEGVL